MNAPPAWPAHKAGLHLTHNEHRNYYETVESAIERGTYSRDDFPDEAEIAACIAADSVWSLQWYPDTPIGFYCVCAATFERVLQLAADVERQTP